MEIDGEVKSRSWKRPHFQLGGYCHVLSNIVGGRTLANGNLYT